MIKYASKNEPNKKIAKRKYVFIPDVKIKTTQEKTNNKVALAADKLKLRRTTLIEKMKKYSLDLYKELEKKVDHSAGLRLNGALSIAQNKGRWQELQRQATTAQLYDVDVRILDKTQIKKEKT